MSKREDEREAAYQRKVEKLHKKDNVRIGQLQRMGERTEKKIEKLEKELQRLKSKR